MGNSRVSIGLVGVPREQSAAVLDPLVRQPRLHVASVFDPCFAAAAELAGRLGARAMPSLRALLRQSHGVVVCAPGWLGVQPINWSIGEGRSLLILSGPLDQLERTQLSEVRDLAGETDVLLMPELLHRWVPSTLRLRELTATRVGAVEAIRLTCRVPGSASRKLAGVLDWCSNVVQSRPRSVHSSADGETLTLRFRRTGADQRPVSAEIRIESGNADPLFPLAGAELVCRHGRVTILGPESLEWQIERGIQRESLSSERSAWDVMFDLFGRRLVGGIVPVPDLADLLRGFEILEAIERSRQSGAETAVPLWAEG